MPISAYSKHLKGECDVVQLLKWLNPGSTTTPDPTHISQADRDFIAGDVICPGCGLGNPSVVVSGRSKADPKRLTSQSHFRFPEHVELCEFEAESNKSSLEDHLVKFSSTNSALTRLIGDRVSKGIELGIFSQETMHAMRKWFLELRRTHSYRCEVDETFISDLFKLPYDYQSMSPKFTPAMARLPDFDPSEFGNQRFIDENQDLYEVLNRHRDALHFMRHNKSIITTRVRRNAGTLIFNPLFADREYKQVRQLIHFMIRHERSVNWPTKFFHDERSNPFNLMSAFCALLLFSNGGDMDRAIEAYVKIRTSEAPANPLLGNIIGLNPFFDHGVLLAIGMAHEVKKLRSNGLVVGKRIDQIRQEISLHAFSQM
ncbi:hypothetical protein [Xanthomonas campestris]|uniref:hypothetical protein n=1 Tax=Xanthomonas campestris TaxID=339 RepID=UPI00236584DB|nr:hypothetical protein [Xanthomonas campestris]MEA9709303.1 hypothetical protein [Xanthomonas campestris]MEA9782929.1 hypothetical protein [Xanthomonas campestris pv. raphani]MEA9791057.1 hypothetical protein [Xanthomonas campestris pv. raphani]MEA9803379.1 hypothetical protein [Xanthomonas campestris pv. raphani]MEA9818969.1 hypothetical protein [Xanthomonas campestris pv. raphani]